MEEFIRVYHKQFALYYQTKVNPQTYLHEKSLHDFATIDAIEALLVFVHGPGVNTRILGNDGAYVCDIMFNDLQQVLFIVAQGKVSMFTYHNSNLTKIDSVPGASIAINHMERLMKQTYKRMIACLYWPGVVDVDDYKRYMIVH